MTYAGGKYHHDQPKTEITLPKDVLATIFEVFDGKIGVEYVGVDVTAEEMLAVRALATALGHDPDDVTPAEWMHLVEHEHLWEPLYHDYYDRRDSVPTDRRRCSVCHIMHPDNRPWPPHPHQPSPALGNIGVFSTGYLQFKIVGGSAYSAVNQVETPEITDGHAVHYWQLDPDTICTGTAPSQWVKVDITRPADQPRRLEYHCTRPGGHDDDHAAYYGAHLLHRWPNG